MSSPVTHITDHAAQLKEDILGQFQDDPIALAICDVVGGEIQVLEDLLWDFITNIQLDNASGDILDRIGKICRVARQGRADDEYRGAIQVWIAAYNSDGGLDQILWIVQNLLSVTCEYDPYPPAAYRLQYETATAISAQQEIDAAKVMDLATSAGVGYQLVQGDDPPNTFRFDSGPGFDTGKLAKRIV